MTVLSNLTAITGFFFQKSAKCDFILLIMRRL